jgi:hypothetical protein
MIKIFPFNQSGLAANAALNTFYFNNITGKIYSLFQNHTIKSIVILYIPPFLSYITTPNNAYNGIKYDSRGLLNVGGLKPSKMVLY